jgi:hypothetical protein
MIITKGYSELLPVACNSADLGREKNRRVEVYVFAPLRSAKSVYLTTLKALIFCTAKNILHCTTVMVKADRCQKSDKS